MKKSLLALAIAGTVLVGGAIANVTTQVTFNQNHEITGVLTNATVTLTSNEIATGRSGAGVYFDMGHFCAFTNHATGMNIIVTAGADYTNGSSFALFEDGAGTAKVDYALQFERSDNAATWTPHPMTTSTPYTNYHDHAANGTTCTPRINMRGHITAGDLAGVQAGTYTTTVTVASDDYSNGS